MIDIRERISEWLEEYRTKHGKHEGYRLAFDKLYKTGLSVSASQKLLAGTYPNEPRREIVNRCLKAMGETK